MTYCNSNMLYDILHMQVIFMANKTVLGTECTLWRNNSAPFPYEVAEKLQLRPGEKFRYVVCDDCVAVEKVE